MKKKILIACLALLSAQVNAVAQNNHIEREIRAFYDAYADDLRHHRTEAVANRYDDRGYFSLGNGGKRFVSFEDNKKHYTTRWTGPKSFAWRDMSFEVLGPDSAAVVGLFDWTGQPGTTDTGSYTAVLIRRSGQWKIRVEDESFNTTGFSTKTITGDRFTPGPSSTL